MSSPLHFIFDLTNHISTYDDDYEEARLQIEKDRNRGYIAIEDWLEIPKDMIESLTPFFWYEEWDIGNGYFDFILRGQINGDLDYIVLIRAIKKFQVKWDYKKWVGHFRYYDNNVEYDFSLPSFMNHELYENNEDFRKMYNE